MAIEPVGNVNANIQKPVDNKFTNPVAPGDSAKPASTHPTDALQRAGPEPSLAQVKQAVQDINKSIQSLARGLEFSIDTSSKKTVIKIIDVQTKEVLRQIPSTQAMEIAKALDQAMGNLIRDQA